MVPTGDELTPHSSQRFLSTLATQRGCTEDRRAAFRVLSDALADGNATPRRWY
jgi:hypothetical protein